mmetsp:Transcript_18672/g.21418  ORF Transcript_18672/g.21418 Transcript_18672/m.21418 type:complete len:384 (+) Transcript_18672:65-1216(+)|eukprot:CAMPEP_0194129320 /NCGR_PEP_ID=MMETSP0152-20130528/575_1 /TAXON_ID=1049557 /ORGANISM="Thalassiothrix antarctica, Strain L6-D1" /LENGTH=383 /DNA_ID=CAMNT_0038823477 /DNA_START=189 /DNA_END=1340 /DNA_ORIENTATION=-
MFSAMSSSMTVFSDPLKNSIVASENNTTATEDTTTRSSSSSTLWDQLYEKMNPYHCLQNSMDYIEAEEPLDVSLKMILSDMNCDMDRRRKKSIQRLYALTDHKHRRNRIELVSKYKIHNSCMVKLLRMPENTRLACLILNNLAIPHENKYILLQSNSLLKELYMIIEELKPETYLSLLLLRNLSNVPDYHYRLINYSNGERPLLRLVEKMLITYAPLIMKGEELQESFLESSFRSSLSLSIASTITPISIDNNNDDNNDENKNIGRNARNSSEFRALTYAMLLLVNLTQTHATSVAHRVNLIECILELIQYLSEHTPLHDWTSDSLGDACLIVLLQLAEDKTGKAVLQKDQLNAPEYLKGLIGKGGIHDTRASWIQSCLEEED